jgi:hypothetical protein
MTSSKVVAQMLANPIPLYKGLSEHMVQATNGQVRIDPVTGNAGIGTPPAAQRTWVGLTNQERSECWETIPELAMKKVEAKLKEKNT